MGNQKLTETQETEIKHVQPTQKQKITQITRNAVMLRISFQYFSHTKLLSSEGLYVMQKSYELLYFYDTFFLIFETWKLQPSFFVIA